MKLKFLSSILLALSLLGANVAQAQSSGVSGMTCQGDLFNPMSDPDWNYIYPITVMGVRTGNQAGVPYHYVPPVCVCPGPFGIPSYGIGITYWEPIYISEIERTPGCMPTLGGMNMLGGSYQKLASESTSATESGAQAANRLQVHWYKYPVFSLLDSFKDSACKTAGGFNLMWMTELDYFWQDDAWGNVLNPEAALFSNPIAQVACAADCAATSLAFPLDPLFWCAGCWGSVYPLTGNGNVGNTEFQRNNLVQAKFLARQHRLGLMMQTIGPTAICFTHPNPVWIKSQYRVNQVGPTPLRSPKATSIGDAAVFSRGGEKGKGGEKDGTGEGKKEGTGEGKKEEGKGGGSALAQKALAATPAANRPTREHTQNLIWQAIQCCARAY